MANDEIIGKIEKLAVKIADEAMGEDVCFDDRVSAFKALTTYFVNTTKAKTPTTDDDEGEGDTGFDKFQQRIAAAASRPGPRDTGRTDG